MSPAFKGGKDLLKPNICRALWPSSVPGIVPHVQSQDRHGAEMSVPCLYTLGYDQSHIRIAWLCQFIPCDTVIFLPWFKSPQVDHSHMKPELAPLLLQASKSDSPLKPRYFSWQCVGRFQENTWHVTIILPRHTAMESLVDSPDLLY